MFNDGQINPAIAYRICLDFKEFSATSMNQIKLLIHGSVPVMFLKIMFPFSDCICWETNIQCEFPTCVPLDQGIDIPNICSHFGYFDCATSYDTAGHYCMHSCFHADWLGDAFGK